MIITENAGKHHFQSSLSSLKYICWESSPKSNRIHKPYRDRLFYNWFFTPPPKKNYLKRETQHRAQASKHVGLINLSLHQPGTPARKQMWNMYKEQGKKRMAVAASSHPKKTLKHTKYETEWHHREYCIFILWLHGESTSWSVSN